MSKPSSPFGAHETTPPNVYDVNAAHAEAYARTKARIHKGIRDKSNTGSAIDDEKGEQAEGDDDDDGYHQSDDGVSDGETKYLPSIIGSNNARALRPGGLSRSKSKRASSRVFLDDEQLINILTTGFQAIKVCCLICFHEKFYN